MTRVAELASIVVLGVLAGFALLLAAQQGERNRCANLDPSSFAYTAYDCAPAEPVETLRWVTPRATPSHAARTHRRTAAGRSGNGTLTDTTCYVWTGRRTASGTWPRVGTAASNRYPFGTRLRVEGVGVVQVEDRIGHGSSLDIFFADRAACLRFGRQHLRVSVLR